MCIYTPLYSTYKGTYSIAFLRENFLDYPLLCYSRTTCEFRNIKGFITFGILITLLALTGILYATAPFVQGKAQATPKPLYEGKFVVVNTEAMKVELKQGTTTLATFPIISKGKPGSYYETIGGAYANDYKIETHFSSIGHVYMPWSVHVFGNYFIHGIPYYPDGTEVSSLYSGGCVRLSNEDAKQVYAFIEKGTPIILTKETESDFAPTSSSTPTESMDMTRRMAAIVSLEVLSQDNIIRGLDGESTTRRELLPRLLAGDDGVTQVYAKARGEQTFIMYMNEKAKSLGMTNTTFISLAEPVTTTVDDEARFESYITTYKSYLLTLAQRSE